MNAKELILEKINASPELAGTYIYMLMTGIQFKDAALFMTNKIVSKVVSKSRKNVYLDNTKYNNVNNAIKYYLTGSLLTNFVQDQEIANRILDALTKLTGEKDPIAYIGKLSVAKILKLKSDLKNFIASKENGINSFSSTKSQYMSEEDWMYMEEMNEVLGDEILDMDYEEGGTEYENYDYTVHLNRFFEDAINRREELDEIGDNDKVRERNVHILEVLQLLYESSRELQILGRGGSLNLGIKTKLEERVSFEINIEDFINGRLKEFLNSPAKGIDMELNYGKFFNNKYGVSADNPFQFDLFTSNLDYRNDMIKFYETAKDTFNVLAIWNSVPHFKAMFDSYGVVDLVSNLFMHNSYTLKKDLMKRGVRSKLFKRNELYKYKKIDRFLLDVIASRYLAQLDINPTILAGYPKYVKGKKTISTEEFILNFRNPDDIATFKASIEGPILDYLRSKYPKNEFVKSIMANYTKDEYGNTYSFILTNMGSDYNDAGSNDRIFNDILVGFNEIKADDIPGLGMNILDTITLYNIIVNSNRSNSSSFSRLLVDVVLDPNSLLVKYSNYIADPSNIITISDYNYSDYIFRMIDYKQKYQDHTKSFKSKTGEVVFNNGNTVSMNTLNGAIKLPLTYNAAITVDRLLTFNVRSNILRLAELNQFELKLECD